MPSGKECVRVEQGLQKCEGLSVIAACRARIEAANFALGSIQASSRTGALEARACYREQRASHAFLLHPPLQLFCAHKNGSIRTQRYKFLPFKNGGTLAFSRAEKAP